MAAAKIRFPNSNNLRFIRTEDYSLLESDTTRLYYDFDYTNISNSCYFQKILQADNLWIQFRTNYEQSAITVYLVDTDFAETDITASLVSGATLNDGSIQYELSLDLSSYLGKYCIKFEFIQYLMPVATYQSEWFEVATSFEDCVKVEWKNGSYNAYNDGIIWSKTQKIFIEGRISNLLPSANKTVFESENYKLLTTQSAPIKSKVFELEPIPDYILELLNIALQHDYFYINSVRYNSEDTFEGERLGDTRLYSGEVTLRLVEDAQGNAYEDYTSDQEITGAYPIFPDIERTTGLETRTTGVETRRTNN